MKNSKIIFALFASLFILASCSNNETEKAETEQKPDEEVLDESVESIETSTETNEALSLTDPLETVKALFQAAVDEDIDTFHELGRKYLSRFPTPPPETMASLAEIITDHGGIESMTIEVIDEEKLTEQYAYFIKKNYGSYGDEVMVVAQWSFNSGAEPKAWVVELNETGNRVIALDVVLELGNKFTFTEEPEPVEEVEESVDENGNTGETIDEILRQSPYITLTNLYEAAYENNYGLFKEYVSLDENTDISASELMTMMRESAVEAGGPGAVRTELIPHEMLNPELRNSLENIYGPDFAFMVEWITEDYLNTFVLTTVDDWYYVFYAEDESKDEFLSEYVNEGFVNYDYD